MHSPNRTQNLLEFCYGNIHNVCISSPQPPLGHSDHHVILLQPKYRSTLKTSVHNPLSGKMNKPKHYRIALNLQTTTFFKCLWQCTDLLCLIVWRQSYSYQTNNNLWPTFRIRTSHSVCSRLNMFSYIETSPSGKRKVKMAKINLKNNVEKKLRSGNAKVAWHDNGPSHQTCSGWLLGLRLLRIPAQQLHHPVQQLQYTNQPDLPNLEFPILSIDKHLRNIEHTRPMALTGSLAVPLEDCSTQLSGVLTRLFLTSLGFQLCSQPLERVHNDPHPQKGECKAHERLQTSAPDISIV